MLKALVFHFCTRTYKFKALSTHASMHPGKMKSLTKTDAIGNSIMYKTFATKITLIEFTYLEEMHRKQ